MKGMVRALNRLDPRSAGPFHGLRPFGTRQSRQPTPVRKWGPTQEPAVLAVLSAQTLGGAFIATIEYRSPG